MCSSALIILDALQLDVQVLFKLLTQAETTIMMQAEQKVSHSIKLQKNSIQNGGKAPMNVWHQCGIHCICKRVLK